MVNRSANATIKGYFYQFDHAIFQLLSSSDENEIITIEGAEDVDIQSANFEELIQCKYYEQTDYNHSIIKPAIIEMLKHFNTHGSTSIFRYKLYGHYKNGQEKLVVPLNLDFVKSNFLTYEKERVQHKVWEELSIDDTKLQEFISRLEINNQASSYSEQIEGIRNLLKQKLQCIDEDFENLYYPAALNAIRKLAIEQNVANRKISPAVFLSRINIKDNLFDRWHIDYLGEEKYKKYINQKYFKSTSSTSIPKAARFFVIEYRDTEHLSEYIECIKKISDKFSNKEHSRTPSTDRFCPYLYLSNISEENLITLKKQLQSVEVNFIDGFGFLGADFDIDRVCATPQKNNKLKILNNIAEFNQAVNFNDHKQSIYTYEFYLTTEISSISANASVLRTKIKISNISSIKEIIK